MSQARFVVSELRGKPVNTDATIPIQRAIDAARNAGGGIVEVPSGFFATSGLTIRSRVTVQGQGEAATTLRLLNKCENNVIETEGFEQNCREGKAWLVTDGMPHGFGVRNIRLHGAKTQNTKGHGLAFYGKRYLVEDVTIVFCAGDGFYSHGPDVGGQEHIDDILESKIRGLNINGCRGNGVTYRGPHDGFIESVVIGDCNGTGLVTETKTGVFNGAVDIGRVHAYSCQKGVHIKTAASSISRLVADTNYEQGVIIDAHRVQIGELWAFRNWRPGSRGKLRSEDPRDDASVELNQACQIGIANVRTDFGGTAIRVNGSRTQLRSLQIENEDPRGGNEPGVGLDVRASLVAVAGDIRGFNAPGSVGLRTAKDKPLLLTTLDCSIVDCATGFVDGHGGDSHDWRIKIQTGDGQKGFEVSDAVKRSDVTIMSRGKDFRTLVYRPDGK